MKSLEQETRFRTVHFDSEFLRVREARLGTRPWSAPPDFQQQTTEIQPSKRVEKIVGTASLSDPQLHIPCTGDNRCGLAATKPDPVPQFCWLSSKRARSPEHEIRRAHSTAL